MQKVTINNQEYVMGQPTAMMAIYSMEDLPENTPSKLTRPKYIVYVNGAWRLLNKCFILTKHKDA